MDNSAREPDLADEDMDQENYKDILGYNSPKEMADALVDEYKETYNSIKKYRGFYVGRYELTGSVAEPTVQKGQIVLSAAIAGDWYELKKACSNVVSNEYVQSEMIYGNQWDEIMSWLKATVFKDDHSKVDEDSSSWGNYDEETQVDYYSGSNEEWKANNIYDIAGNCSEWTQEVSVYNGRTVRGDMVVLTRFVVSGFWSYGY